MKRQILKLDESNRRLRDEAQAVELKLGKDGYLLNQLEDLKSKNMKLNKNVESKLKCTKEKSPELCLTASIVTFTQISPQSNDEKQPDVDMIDREPRAKQDQSEFINKMIQLKRKKSILLIENKQLERKLSASEARVEKLKDDNTVL